MRDVWVTERPATVQASPDGRRDWRFTVPDEWDLHEVTALTMTGDSSGFARVILVSQLEYGNEKAPVADQTLEDTESRDGLAPAADKGLQPDGESQRDRRIREYEERPGPMYGRRGVYAHLDPES